MNTIWSGTEQVSKNCGDFAWNKALFNPLGEKRNIEMSTFLANVGKSQLNDASVFILIIQKTKVGFPRFGVFSS